MHKATAYGLLLAGGLSFGGVGLFAADEEGTPVKLASLPAAARACIETNLENGKLGEIIKTVQGSDVRYSVELIKPHRTRSFTINDQGELLDRQMFMGELPRAIQQAIRKQAGKGRIDEITKTMEDGEVSYDVEMTREGKSRSVTLAENGEVQETQMFLDELPDEIQKAIGNEAGKGKVGDIFKTREDGEVMYDTDVSRDGKSIPISVNARGELVYREEPVVLTDTPEAVQKAIQAEMAGSKLSRIQKMYSDGEVSYVARLAQGGTNRSLALAPNGKVISSDGE